ncbi:imelysin family protein [Aliarcobacter thereius]|nr:imelysin family protein [Aliarcobacter thereius]OCL89646.1 Imelysin [Aliarcobacter thereius]OCL95582.1 Imelysin [Aliarcobacter thereius LMG 24486]OCL96524.1 Imelysin [Aliarcobacter thereius]QBF16433.1 peptidase, M75 family [Aliarcobacter thereius LMG 24486]HJE03426.1 imelysin [Aliarcobacter thereius]
MKKLIIVALFAINLFANSSVFQSILGNVSINDTNNAINSAKALQKGISKENFKKFLKDWKSVETLYLAGELDYDYIDTPRFIDVFNNLKEDLNSQMQRVIDSSKNVQTSLYKNSFKTINALEYVISKKELNSRDKEIIKVILDSIISHLEDIKEVYEAYLTNPTKDEKEEIAILVNSLVASSYRLKEWRIGNPAGLSTKYKNDQKNNRAEYFLSQNSFEAIISILETQLKVVDKQEYKNLYSFSYEKSAKEEIDKVSNTIKQTLEEINKLNKDDFSNASRIFELASYIHDLYYITIIEKLALKPEILDADGD